jgi:hypothetical protein
MATEQKNKPVKEFRFGAIKVAVWRREHEGKTFYSTSVSRSYKTEQKDGPDDDGWRETNSFDFTDLETLKMALEMAQKWIKTEILAAV